MKEAKRVAETLAALDSRQKAESQTNKIAIRRKTLLRVTSLPPMTECCLNVGLANGHMATYQHPAAPNATDPSTRPFCTPRHGTQSLSGSNTEGRHEGSDGSSIGSDHCFSMLVMCESQY
jgi:hypothetical protein